MKKSRRKFSAKFKSQVAIEAIKERESLAELSKRFELHPNQITHKYPGGSENFWGLPTKYLPVAWSAPNTSDIKKERDRLHQKIGELEMDRDSLKKV